MDSNGTKFHLLYGEGDWAGCLVETPAGLVRLGDAWQLGEEERRELSLEWDGCADVLRLARRAPRFRQSRRTPRLELDARRGAGRDRYGNWYWIDPAQRAILRLPRLGRAPEIWYAPELVEAACPQQLDDEFRACAPTPPPQRTLRGLAVTGHHYLVAGSPSEHGLLVFDLHGGGAPFLVRWPQEVAFDPWDIAPAPGGGVLVLDRTHLTYWALDADFRLLALVDPDEPVDFQPVDLDSPRRSRPGAVWPTGFPLAPASPPEPLHPVSIEAGPDGLVLILDSAPERSYSIVHVYRGAERVAELSLERAIEVVDPQDGTRETIAVAAHDFVCIPGCHVTGSTNTGCATGTPCQASGVEAAGAYQGRSNPILYLAEREGNQAYAFELVRADDGLRLDPKPAFLPLRRWGARALVGVGDDLFYDFGNRWVPLRVFAECVYAGRAVLVTPAEFGAGLPGQPFDSGEPGCVWHRLILDAAIPQGGRVLVRARAADDPALLPDSAWIVQPEPYLRGGGAELPFFEPWADRRDDASPLGERTGSWELLFQEVRGRYVQLQIELLGTGRSSLELRALRAWYPRFSYLERYLPAIYREEPGPASFLERWLANFEGLYTNLEDKIAGLPLLLDPRTAPPDTLEWLGCWLGLVLDPLLSEAQRRFMIRHAERLYRQRGTLPGVEQAVRLFLDAAPDESLFDPRCLGRGSVRVVEQFRTRGVGGLAFGDPTDAGERPLRPLTVADAAASAHRFSVLVPHTLGAEQLDMVGRIVQLEKPAHTAHVLKRFWDLFRAGEARLGLDTRLGPSGRFVPLELGAGYLTESYLEAPYPFDIADRVVSDRDRLGDMAPL
jgi:phage tail-like protein